MREAHLSRQTNSQTHPHTCTSPVQRLAALSKKSLTDGSFPFFFHLTDLSSELRWWWYPICLCTFKGARPHTRSVFIQVDACSRNKLNQMSALQTSFQIPPALSTATSWPLILFSQIFSHPTTSNILFFFTLFFILLVVLCAPVLISQSTLPSQSECTVLCAYRPVQRMAEPHKHNTNKTAEKHKMWLTDIASELVQQVSNVTETSAATWV